MELILSHAHAALLLGAWALDACDGEEAAAVEAHLTGCAECTAEARGLLETTGWLAAVASEPPPAHLRERVLEGPSVARRPFPEGPPQVSAYVAEVARLDVLLSQLSEADWQAVAVPGWRVQDLVAHLLANESMLGSSLGLAPVEPEISETAYDARTAAFIEAHRRRPPGATLAAWRRQVNRVAADLVGRQGDELRRRVEWFGLPLPLGHLLVTRAFESWIHGDDVRRALGRPPEPPPPERMHLIADAAVRALPAALALTGDGRDAPVPSDRSARSARVVLTGAGGGEWVLSLARGAQPGQPGGAGPAAAIDVVLEADAVQFCLLAAGRLAPEALPYIAQGDTDLAARLVHAAPAFAAA